MEQESYKDFKIEYNEEYDRWEGREVESGVDFKSTGGLASLKKKIDVYKRKTNPLKGKVCLIQKGWHRDDVDFTEVIITSVTDDGRVWIKNSHGSREKLYLDRKLYSKNKENQGIIEEMAAMNKEVIRLQSSIRKLVETLEVVLTVEND